MTRTKITFSYEETCDFSPPTVVTMEMPERRVEEMCEYFQRFLMAAGYLLNENEHIGIVRTERTEAESLYPFPLDDDPSSGVCGSMSEDLNIIKCD